MKNVDGRSLDCCIVSSMPVLAGNKAMTELHTSGCTIPFVLISSDSSGADDYFREGATAFMSKIYTPFVFLTSEETRPR